MRTFAFAALTLCILSHPAAAQSTPGGTSAGGPARVGIPGQIGGGVPGSQPNVVEQRLQEKKAAMEASKEARKTRKKSTRKKAM